MHRPNNKLPYSLLVKAVQLVFSLVLQRNGFCEGTRTHYKTNNHNSGEDCKALIAVA